MNLDLVSLLVAEYDPAIAFFVDVLGFDLVEDSPALTMKGGLPKRWVVVRGVPRCTALGAVRDGRGLP